MNAINYMVLKTMATATRCTYPKINVYNNKGKLLGSTIYARGLAEAKRQFAQAHRLREKQVFAHYAELVTR